MGPVLLRCCAVLEEYDPITLLFMRGRTELHFVECTRIELSRDRRWLAAVSEFVTPNLVGVYLVACACFAHAFFAAWSNQPRLREVCT